MIARVSHPRTPPARAGFSLVELLMVMAIIAIMAGLAFVMLGQTGQVAREAATRGGIQVINAALEDRLRGFENITQPMALADPDLPAKRELREFRKQTLRFVTLYNGGANVPPANQTLGEPEAEVYVRKALFKAIFPQREIDLWGMDGVIDFNFSDLNPHTYTYVDDSPLLSRMLVISAGSARWNPDSWKGREIAASTSKPEAESAELLYVALTEGDVLGLPPESLDGIDRNLIGDTDSDGNLELLDAWGRPLRFYNWPTRLFKADGTAYTATDYNQASVLVSGLPLLSSPAAQKAMMNRDPADNASRLSRMRKLMASNDPMTYPPPVEQYQWFYGDFNLSGRTNPGRALGPDWYHDRDCYYVTLIVSAGPDGQLGMALPNASAPSHLGLVTNAADLADNLSNRQKGPQ